MDLYLKPFVEKLKDLHKNGIDCFCNGSDQSINIKVHILISPVNSLARCCLQNYSLMANMFFLFESRKKFIKVGNG